jgi:hypothetical protein
MLRQHRVIGIVNGVGIDRQQAVGWGVLAVNAINNQAQTVGIYDYARDETRLGMFFDDGQTIHTYTTLLGRDDVRGNDLNEASEIAGVSLLTIEQVRELGYPEEVYRAFTMKDGVARELPQKAWYSNSLAYAINNDGWVVGFAQSTQERTASLWVGDSFYKLDELVTNLPEGVVLLEGHDINNHGQIVVLAGDETGIFPMLLTPVTIPEPGAVFGLALMGAWAMSRRGKRHAHLARFF